MLFLGVSNGWNKLKICINQDIEIRFLHNKHHALRIKFLNGIHSGYLHYVI